MTNQFDLDDEQRQIQEMAKAFTASAITPHAAEWDEKHIFPREAIRSAAELGFGSIYVSEESGGIGLGRLEAALIMEAMAYGCPSTSAFISIHNMASWMIDRFGAQAVKDKYLPSMVTMERIGSYCLTEPGSGSDAAALKTRAVRDGGDYVVSGSKAFISGGGENEIYVCMVRTGVDGPKGISCLVIEKDMPGVSFGAQEKKLGWHSQPTAQVNFDEVRVPAENLVGEEGKAWRYAKFLLVQERLIAAETGRIRHLLAGLRAVAATVQEAGRPLSRTPAFAARIADIAIDLAALEAVCARLLAHADGDAPGGVEVNMLKIRSSELQQRVTEEMIRALGRLGIPFDPADLDAGATPPDHWPRGAAGMASEFMYLRAATIYGGSNEIQRGIIAKQGLGL